MMVALVGMILEINKAESEKNFQKAKELRIDLEERIKHQVKLGSNPTDLTDLLGFAGWDDYKVCTDGRIVEMKDGKV